MTAVFAGTVCSVGYTRIKQISMGKKIHNNINGAGGRKSRLYVSWVVTIVIAFLIVIPVRRFCIESYRISTSAMEDALHQGDYILVNKLPFEGNPGRNKVSAVYQSAPERHGEYPIVIEPLYRYAWGYYLGEWRRV